MAVNVGYDSFCFKQIIGDTLRQKKCMVKIFQINSMVTDFN